MFFQGRKEREELLAVFVSLLLAVVKGIFAFWTGALSLFASALDSLFDFFVSSINLVTLIVSQRKPDEDHQFGHEKAEALAALFQGLLIIVSAGYLIYSSFQRFWRPFEIKHVTQGMAIITLSMMASLWLAFRLRRSSRATGSLVLKTDALHYATDLYGQGGILIALALIQWSGWRLWDPLVTLPLSLYIAWQGFFVAKEAIDELMDREKISPEISQEVRRIISRHKPYVIDLHNFKTRRAGGKRFIQLHIEMKRDLTFEKVHEVTETITHEICRAFGNVSVIIHPDPEGVYEDESDRM